MTDHTELLVIGAGPYAYSAAAYARDQGIETRIVGRPMSLWRKQMPTDMFLRSGPDWHLDGSEQDTFAAYFEDRGLDPRSHDPIPIEVFLGYTDWFADRKSLGVEERMVASLSHADGSFAARMDDGTTVTSEKVLAVPGIAYFTNLPDWWAEVPVSRRSHTSELVDFGSLSGARVAVIGGRQSAYEWAALLADHGAAQVDVVHRHDTPRFERVSWSFLDDYVELTEANRGWWRGLSSEGQQAIALRFWQVGRLTLEWWLLPRLPDDVVHRHPKTEVTKVGATDEGVSLALSDGTALEVDHVVFASGYRAQLASVPYLAGVLDQVSVTDGFPDLTPGMETSLAGLFVSGFAATRDFGPFYGFTKGCPSAARIAVGEMVSR